MRVLVAEWRVWTEPFSTRLSALLALAVAALLLFSQLQPNAFSVTVLFAGLIAGWMSGSQKWNRLKSWDWLGEHRVAPAAYVLGKACGFLLAWVALLLPLLPFAVLLTLRWGLPGEVLALMLGYCLATALAGQTLTHLLAYSDSEFGRLVAVPVLAAAVFVGMRFPQAEPWSPVLQVWRLTQTTDQTQAWASLGLLVGLDVVLVLLLTPVMAFRRGRA